MRTTVTLLLAFGSLALAQGVLDKLKQKVDQLIGLASNSNRSRASPHRSRLLSRIRAVDL